MVSQAATVDKYGALPRFGQQLPGCEPYWYQGNPSPYYHDGHVRFRATCRRFVEEELKPNLDEWIEKGEYPRELHQRAYDLGIGAVIYPKKYGGTQPEDYDHFYELVKTDELARIGARRAGVLWQENVSSMAMPPIMFHGSEQVKKEVVRDVVMGRKHVSLMISEPHAGSDVAGIKTTAVRDGDAFVVNGQKKWITGGFMADFFMAVVRTGGPGAAGISLVLIPAGLPGIHIRKMKTQFDSTHGTTFITLDNVRVPAGNLLGELNQGFKLLVYNFNHERWLIAIGSCRGARTCFEEAFQYSLRRQTFGKKLVEHPVIRFKLSEMMRQIESLHDFNERVAYAFSKGMPDSSLGIQCALLKLQASKTFEYCAREAAQIFGGNSILKEGVGKIVERLGREVRGQAIPGGSEEILGDLAIRMSAKVKPHVAQAKL